ncbi:MAG: Clp protease N-terminal domain-containing protein [Planctomycetota bacterium]
MFERFTERARKVMTLANEEALRFGHDRIGTEHIFLALLKEGSGKAATILRDRGVDIEAMLTEIEQILKLKGTPEPAAEVERPETPHAVKVIEYAIEEAIALDHDYIGTEHILLGLLRESEGVAAQVLANLGVNIENVRAGLQ